MDTKILHFDSIDTNYGQLTVYPALDGVKTVSLKSCINDLPNNIRSENNSNLLSLNIPNTINYSYLNISTALFVPLENRTFAMSVYYNNTARSYSYTLSTYFYTDIHDILNEINTYMLDQINNHSSNWLNSDYNTATPPNFNIYDNGGYLNIDTSVDATVVPVLNGFTYLLGYTGAEQCTGGFLSFLNAWNISSFDPTNPANINLELNSSYSTIQALLTDINNGILNYFDGNTNYVLYFDIDENNYVRCNTNSYYVDITDCPINAILGYSYGDNTVYNPDYPSLNSQSFDRHYDLSLYSNTITLNVSITEGNFPFIGDLINNINSALETSLSSYSGYSAVLSVADTNNPFVVIPANIPITINKTTLSLILGFNGLEVFGQGSINAINKANIIYDTSFYLYLDGLPCSNNSASGKRHHFKIPASSDTPNQYHDNLSFQQVMKMTNPSYTINSIKPVFVDRFGYNMTVNSYNFTIEFGF